MDLAPGDPACNVDVSVDARGLVVVTQKSGRTVIGQLGENELRFEVDSSLAAQLSSSLDVPPGPCATAQVFSSVTGEGAFGWRWAVVPAVQ